MNTIGYFRGDGNVGIGTTSPQARVEIEGAGSPVLTNIIEGLQARVRLLRATSMGEPGRAEEAAAELRLVAEAATRRQAGEAARYCAAHVRNAAKTALKSLRAAESGTEA